MATLADRIRAILAARGWSQSELNRRAGFNSRSQLGNTLRRLQKDPETAIEVDTLRAIARGAGVRFQWLLSGEGEPDLPADENHDAPSPSTIGQVIAPRLDQTPNWPQQLERAKRLAPEIPEDVWARTGETAPLANMAITPGAIADLARLILKHVPPPANDDGKHS